jgi:sRNA-binding carbon storage regulator CsrA
MLVLTRYKDESIMVGQDVEVTVIDIRAKEFDRDTLNC